MPLYDIKCEQTGKTFERVIPLKMFEEPIICACGSPARRVISAPLFSVDQTNYTCPVTGDYIGSKRAHEENLRKHDCRVLEPGEKEFGERRRKEADLALDRKIEATVEKEIESMGSEKREKLYNELVHTDLEVARK